MASSEYFDGVDAALLSGDQRRVISKLRECMRSPSLSHLEPHATHATFDDPGVLTMAIASVKDPTIKASIVVDEYGEIEISCSALHPTFVLRYNLRWEPEEALGDADDAVEVMCALLAGRIQSEVLWGYDAIARTKDVLIEPSGSEKVLYTRYHADGLIGALFQRRRELRTVTFG